MSNFKAFTKHPVTGKVEKAEWLDDYFGNHKYGVVFPNDSKVYYEGQIQSVFTEESSTVEIIEGQNMRQTLKGKEPLE